MIRSIVAFDQKRGMAKHGFQPWYIPDDEHYFTEQTKSHGGLVLVGRTTFSTFKGPLVDRRNYVLTHQSEPIDGVELVSDLDQFFEDHKGEDIWIVGGAAVFTQTMERADELYITAIEADFGCDQFFPEYDERFELSWKSEQKQQNGFSYRYEIHKTKG